MPNSEPTPAQNQPGVNPQPPALKRPPPLAAPRKRPGTVTAVVVITWIFIVINSIFACLGWIVFLDSDSQLGSGGQLSLLFGLMMLFHTAIIILVGVFVVKLNQGVKAGRIGLLVLYAIAAASAAAQVIFLQDLFSIVDLAVAATLILLLTLPSAVSWCKPATTAQLSN
ncbi:hypothetical protein [Natronoglycomyces albus]|uniref:Uncharacterized protein n=1 Tax=Natronoglycomyces albus TaxID=2811108 RepID=A0A895XTV7_9ACTN|nr:hypothetical protein [Natronoglycomyces albus]QSB05078.1 hypothetical protein JQS30_15165 [Natronoglycomyces albus]